MSSAWNQPKNKKPEKDSFWYGFLSAFTLPAITIISIFKLKYTTTQPLFEAMLRLAENGFLGTDMFSSTLPSFVLFFVFYKLKKERAAQGVFVGVAPWLILSFWLI